MPTKILHRGEVPWTAQQARDDSSISAGNATHARAVDKIVPEGLRGASSAIVYDFAYMSTLNTTNLQAALTFQPLSQNGINPVNAQKSDQAGVGFALAPWSETPVAIQPTQTGRGGGSGQSLLLKPGQVHFPGADFCGFTWGLPFGWLGGGLAHLIVIKERGGNAFWTDDPEVIFHRVTLPIYATTDNPAVLMPNMPLRFPWQFANGQRVSGVAAFPGAPRVNVIPTKTIFRLRQAANTVGGATTRLLFVETDQFDGNGQGTYFANTASWVDLYWQVYAATGFQVNGTALSEYPTQTMTADTLRLGGDACALAIVSLDAAIPNTSFMDVIRYGKLGGG